MKTALGLWVILTVLCLGQGHHEGQQGHHEGQQGHHEGHQGHGHSHSHKDEHEHHHQENNSSLTLVKMGNDEFAFGLYKQLIASNIKGKNVFFSPISVTLALAALSVGARGQTHQELFNGLGFNNTHLTQNMVDEAFHTLLNISSDKSAVDMDAGTALYVHNTFQVKPEFLANLKHFYLAESFNIDFTKNTEAADTINEYVKEKTGGKIDKLVQDLLDPSTVMYLLSYIYYKGTWKVPFVPSRTKGEPFHVDDKTEVQIQMMHVQDEFSTYYDEEIKTTILHLNYNDSNFMILALPDKGNNLSTLEKVICKNHVTKWQKGKQAWEVNLAIPKFSIKTSFSLGDMLNQMGMSSMFNNADFSGISDKNVKVSQVVHQASIDVDEFGVTAAAATEIGITNYSAIVARPLKFDRPFMVMIIDSETDSILFMGKIVNPKE